MLAVGFRILYIQCVFTYLFQFERVWSDVSFSQTFVGWARVKKCNLLTILSSSRIVPNEVEGQFARAQKLYGWGLENRGSDGVYMKKWVSGSEVRFEPPLPPVLDLSVGLPLVPLNPQVCIDPQKNSRNKSKYIADPLSGFPTNRLLVTARNSSTNTEPS